MKNNPYYRRADGVEYPNLSPSEIKDWKRRCEECSTERDLSYFDRSLGRNKYSKYFRKKCRFCRTNQKFFGGNRLLVLERDGYKCTTCHITRDEHIAKFKKDLAVDHIDGLGNGVPIKMKNNKMENLITLCSSCHGKKGHKRRDRVQLAINHIFDFHIRRYKYEGENLNKIQKLRTRINKMLNYKVGNIWYYGF